MKTAAFILSLLMLLPLSARTWTNSDGKTIEADFVSADQTSVALIMNGKEIKYPLAKLSAADQDWIKAQNPAKKPPAEVKTGLLKDIPISSSLYPEIDDHFKDSTRKASIKAFEGGAFDHDKKRLTDWSVRDPQNDRCDIYVPASYDGSEPYGLVLYIDAGVRPNFRSDWAGVFDKIKLIFVGAHGVSNNTAMPRRVLLSIDALATVEKHYKIDPARRVVTGMSGGGHMSMLTAALYPELFKGAVSYAAQSYLPGAGTFGHFPGFDLSDFKSRERKKMKWVVISGDKDKNYEEILTTSKDWKNARLDYRFIDVPGMGHSLAAAADLKTALDWIGL